MHALFKTLWSATKCFLIEKVEATKSGPHIRDSLDLKRVMMLVVMALIPCTLMAIWNTGVQSYVYSYQNPDRLLEYLQASTSISLYFLFCKTHFIPILFLGLKIFLPTLILIYLVGGFWEALFASIKGKEISEGFLVTGILFALVLPSTLPYWMVVVGVSIGIVIGKELFGGTGMNILNPALICRCILYFTFPAYMTGQVWIGESAETVRVSLAEINKDLSLSGIDGYTADTMLQVASTSENVKRIHVDAVATSFTNEIEHIDILQDYLKRYDSTLSIKTLSATELYNFVTDPNGLGLPSEFYTKALSFAKLKYGHGTWTNWNFFLGNMAGSMGETSKLACLLGAIFLILTRIASWHTMLFVLLGSFCTALTFQLGSHLGPEFGLWNPANYDLPAYKQLLLGGLAFGLVFMATDPVSSPTRISARCVYGFLIGFLTIIIRLVNPAFPEGVMLAILFGNVFAPLFDRIAIQWYRKPFTKRKNHA